MKFFSLLRYIVMLIIAFVVMGSKAGDDLSSDIIELVKANAKLMYPEVYDEYVKNNRPLYASWSSLNAFKYFMVVYRSPKSDKVLYAIIQDCRSTGEWPFKFITLGESFENIALVQYQNSLKEELGDRPEFEDTCSLPIHEDS